MTERESILVVDDNAANLKLVAFLLTSRGYDVRTAGSADEALAAVSERVPRLILMDIQLPGMDGLELTRRFKSDARTRDTIIIALTAYAMKGDEQRARDAGCDDYLTKPIDTHLLKRTVDEHLQKARPRPEERK